MAGNLSMRNTAPTVTTRPQDWALLVLAIWLFISPWVLHFGSVPAGGTGNSVPGLGHAAWNAWILGIILFLVTLSAVNQMRANQEWIALVLGAWIFAAPWALGFVPLPRASWDHWLVGGVVFFLALSNLARAGTLPPGRDFGAPPSNEQPPT